MHTSIPTLIRRGLFKAGLQLGCMEDRWYSAPLIRLGFKLMGPELRHPS